MYPAAPGRGQRGSLIKSYCHDDNDFDDEDNDEDGDDDAEHGDQQQRAGSLVTSSSRGSFCCTQLENSHNGARLACCLDKGSQNIWFLIHKKIFVLSFVDLLAVHGGPNMDWSNSNGIGFFQENCFLL